MADSAKASRGAQLRLHQPQARAVEVIRSEFYKHRRLVGPPGAPGGGAAEYTQDAVVDELTRLDYVRLEGVSASPRGARSKVVFIILAQNSQYALHSPKLKALLAPIVKGPDLDEVYLIAEPAFFDRSPLVDYVYSLQAEHMTHNPAGQYAYVGAYPIAQFCLVIPDHASVGEYTLLSDAEKADLVRQEYLASANRLPALPYNDPPVVWAGGRVGQVVRVCDSSTTAVVMMGYYYIVYTKNLSVQGTKK